VSEPTRLRDLALVGTYSTGDQPLTRFYVPALQAACRYDRMAGYYSSAVLRVAARGILPFLRNAQEHGGRMRLIVGSQLSPADVAAVRAGDAGRDDVIARGTRAAPVALDGDAVGDQYLTLLGWMVREGLLQVKVGVPVDAAGVPLEPDDARGYFHSKYGILTDPHGDRVAFLGSDNETARGWLYNHETFTVAKSWLPEVWAEQGEDIAARFERHWEGSPDSGWALLDLPGIDDRLLKLVPHDYLPPDTDPIWAVVTPPTPPPPRPDADEAWAELSALADLPAAQPFTAALTAPVDPLPHQVRLLHRAVTTFPRGYLFADEVGLGKTIETGLVIRELLLSGRARNALLLVPASVLKQWQEELHEKLGLDVPRYDGGQFLDPYGQPVPVAAGTNPWSAFPIVLASSHLARRKARQGQVVAGGPWDIVLVDEAHHARRRGTKATDTPNALLTLLHKMRAAGSWKALYLATATPMQMNAHEAWDLIELLDLPGRWGRSALDFTTYYAQLRHDPAVRSWTVLQQMLSDYFSDTESHIEVALQREINAAMGLVPAQGITKFHKQGMSAEQAANLNTAQADYLDRWLRQHTPMRDRVFRNTRQTMRDYQAAGILSADVVIPHRHVVDEFIELSEWERRLYERIEDYIRRHYNAYLSDKSTQALGFIMTIYRRRLTSSFYAIAESLRRRLKALEDGQTLADLLNEDDARGLEDDRLLDVDDLDVSIDLLRGEIAELRDFVADLDTMVGEDTKASQLVADLTEALKKYTTAVVFTQYADTMDYVRQRLLTAGFSSIGCYSGRGGELWDDASGTWLAVAKAEIKQRFREGNIQVLIGTDSMSEGLNLQTCGRLFNYDMPWNLMRAEQRIGRVDRIGATYPDIEVTNYFYADTVEEAVYKGILEDFGDFTDIVGGAQPVLAEIEDAIGQLALGAVGAYGAGAASDALDRIKERIGSLRDADVSVGDLGDQPAAQAEIEAPPDISPAITVGDLGMRLLANPLTAGLLAPLPNRPGVYRLSPVAGPRPTVTLRATPPSRSEDLSSRSGHPGGPLVTFDRATAERAADDVRLLTYGSPDLEGLLPAPKRAPRP
jgi:superfamily II DNA or RNA helicase